MNYNWNCTNPNCGWTGSRYANLKRCPKCHGDVSRAHVFTNEEVAVLERDGLRARLSGALGVLSEIHKTAVENRGEGQTKLEQALDDIEWLSSVEGQAQWK